MTADDAPEPTREVRHYALLILFMVTMIVSQFVAQRPLLYGLHNNVAFVGVAPADVVPDPGEDWSVMIRRNDWRPPIAALLGHGRSGRPVRLGWVVRQGSLFSLPLFGWRISELAVVTEDGYGYRISGLSPDQRAALERRGAIGWLPWWRLGWGWLPFAALAGFVWGELRWQARRRALLGIM